MRNCISFGIGSLAAVLGLPAIACIQIGHFIEPHNPDQLPADIFKIHIHLKPAPLMLDMKLLNGTISTPVGKSESDPQVEFSDVIREYESTPAKHASLGERNDYAAALLFAGRYADAIPVLVQVEHDYPGNQATAANLGTAYELVGDIANAKVWIKKGAERNPDAHDGTEWLHLAILDAKQRLAVNHAWLADHSVLDGEMERPRIELEHALEYQLNERLYFIKNDDPIMCDLLYQAAAITDDSTKRAYYLRQVPRFGSIRERQVRKLLGG